jgi:hypothetical protein
LSESFSASGLRLPTVLKPWITAGGAPTVSTAASMAGEASRLDEHEHRFKRG